MNRRPWRAVVRASGGEGSSNILNRAQGRTARWWDLDLDCGHHVVRGARYRPTPAVRHGHRPRRSTDMLPAPARVRCDHCPKEPT